MIIGQEPQQLTWKLDASKGTVGMFTVTHNRAFDHHTEYPIIAWCWDHVGKGGTYFQHRLDVDWEYIWLQRWFSFRREADMVMFVLDHTISG